MYTGAFVRLLATLPSYSDGELLFIDEAVQLVIERTYLFTNDVLGN